MSDATPAASKPKKKMNLSTKFLIGMVLGAIVGLVFREKVSVISFLGDIFMRLLRMCMFPMVLLSIITAVAQVADIGRLKKVGGMFIAYVICGSGIAGIFGAIAFYIVRPGSNLHWTIDAGSEGVQEASAAASSVGSTLINNIVNWVPSNPFESLSTGTLVQIVFFALFFGIVLAVIRDSDPNTQFALKCIDGLNKVVLGMINAVLQIAPIGIFAMVANMVGTTGFDAISAVGGFMLAYYIGIVVFFILLLVVVIKFGCHLSPIRYIRNVFPVIITALSTLSSAGTIPVTSEATKKNLGVPSDIVDLLVAPAATINMNGAAVEQVAYIIFASFCYDVKLSIPQLILSVILCVVMSIGAAGVPGGGVIMGTICMGIMGFPDEVVLLIAGVYTIMDFGATVVNVLGDTVGMTFIASKLGELDTEVYNGDNVV